MDRGDLEESRWRAFLRVMGRQNAFRVRDRVGSETPRKPFPGLSQLAGSLPDTLI